MRAVLWFSYFEGVVIQEDKNQKYVEFYFRCGILNQEQKRIKISLYKVNSGDCVEQTICMKCL